MSYISIIIPAYNAQKHLPMTIDRLVKQPAFDRCQLILVNDGSKDGTLTLYRRYAEQYPNILVVDQENKGVSAARNAGVRRAEGEFIMFSDADDYYTEGFLCEELFGYLAANQADIYAFSSYQSNVRRNRFADNMKLQDGWMRGGQIVSWPGHFASLIYRRSFLIEKDVWFDEGISMNEDYVFLLKAFYQANLILTSSRYCYIYNTTLRSLSSPPFKDNNWVRAWEQALIWFSDHARNEQELALARQFCGAKRGSRMLFFAKHYLGKGHSPEEMVRELQRLNYYEELMQLQPNQVMNYQVEELKLFQTDRKAFVKLARKEALRMKVGMLLLQIPPVRAIRDSRRFPMTEI